MDLSQRRDWPLWGWHEKPMKYELWKWEKERTKISGFRWFLCADYGSAEMKILFISHFTFILPQVAVYLSGSFFFLWIWGLRDFIWFQPSRTLFWDKSVSRFVMSQKCYWIIRLHFRNSECKNTKDLSTTFLCQFQNGSLVWMSQRGTFQVFELLFMLRTKYVHSTQLIMFLRFRFKIKILVVPHG